MTFGINIKRINNEGFSYGFSVFQNTVQHRHCAHQAHIDRTRVLIKEDGQIILFLVAAHLDVS